MNDLSRRAFTQGTLGSLLTYSLFDTLFSRQAFSAEVQPIAAKWLAAVDEASRDLRGKPLEQIAWQQQVEALLSKVDLPELLKFIDFDKLTADVPLKDKGERSVRARLPQVEGLPTELVFGHQIFVLGKDRSVVPHGHNNMATAFLILKGEFRGRHYDRLEDVDDCMIIRPTLDRAFAAGECATISDYKDNVHWFTCTGDAGYIFNIHVVGLMTGKPGGGRVYCDPNGEKLSDNRIKAKKIGYPEAYRLYG